MLRTFVIHIPQHTECVVSLLNELRLCDSVDTNHEKILRGTHSILERRTSMDIDDIKRFFISMMTDRAFDHGPDTVFDIVQDYYLNTVKNSKTATSLKDEISFYLDEDDHADIINTLNKLNEKE